MAGLASRGFLSCPLVRGGPMLPRPHFCLPSASLIYRVVWVIGQGSLAGSTSPFFSVHFSKIFILNDLPRRGQPESAQNAEPQELTGKIFQNKELAWSGRSIFFLSGFLKY